MPCHIEWRPSRWLVAALCLLGVLAAVSVLASNLPGTLKPVIAGITVLTGLAQARREALRRPVSLAWKRSVLLIRPAGSQEQMLLAPTLLEQGPMLRLQAFTAGGQRWSRTWWPDTLTGLDRRRLRLAAAVSPRSEIHLPSMAA